MKTVEAIIAKRGGQEGLKARHIRIENSGYMPLVIEYIGTGPRGLPLISVAHYYTQNGDPMRDPEMTFEIDPEGKQDWGPVTYQQDNLGIYQEAVWCEDNGRVMVRPVLVKDLKSFARTWDRNLKEQGFLKAA
jgi:Domain of unknown function (DUF6908)